MTIPQSPIPPGLMPELAKMTSGLQASAVATLTAAFITAAGRPFSIGEMLELNYSIFYSIYGGQVAGHGAYQAWAKEKQKHLDKVWS